MLPGLCFLHSQDCFQSMGLRVAFIEHRSNNWVHTIYKCIYIYRTYLYVCIVFYVDIIGIMPCKCIKYIPDAARAVDGRAKLRAQPKHLVFGTAALQILHHTRSRVGDLGLSDRHFEGLACRKLCAGVRGCPFEVGFKGNATTAICAGPNFDFRDLGRELFGARFADLDSQFLSFDTVPKGFLRLGRP